MQNTIKLCIGRGHDAHVRVTDISVSRLHAFIIKSTLGYYYLSDNDSKFGTLALVRYPLQMLPSMKT
jgi:pSer/pThr/pTyr-binding forkhead associated (FHA) protein